MPSTDPPPCPPDADAVMGRWQRAAESARDGLWEMHLASGRAWFSDRLGALLGFAAGEFTGDVAALTARVHLDELPAWRHALHGARDHGRAIDLELRLLDCSGHWRWMAVRARTWPGDDGRPALLTGAVTDIHEARVSQLALERLVAERTASLARALADAEHGRREAQHASEAQSRFLAHMSHELRTPLAGLLSLVDLTRRVSAEPAHRRYLDVAMQSGRMLQRTIDNVLHLTRMRSDAPPAADDSFDVAEAVAEVLRGVMPLVRRKGLSMRYDWVGEPTWVRGDELRLRQIVGNLVSNAAKFTDHGHIALWATLETLAAPASGLRLTLDVEDSGPGLAADSAARMFDAFVQGDQSLSRPHGGAGLGLTIARDLARRMGGDVTLRSTVGVGSVFSLVLPLRGAPDPDPLPAPPPGHAWLLYRQPEHGEWLQRRLGRLHWSAEVLTSCEAAAARARSLPPAEHPALVVLTEQVLRPEPDLDALRSALPQAHLSLLIRPDWDQPALEQRALSLGITLDVAPLTPRGLRLMTHRHASAPAAAPAPATGPAPAAAAGDVLVVEDNAINCMIAEEFLRTLGLPVRTAHDGAQALAACAEAAPRLVLMDLQMPVMDGLTATHALRERQRRGELPAFPIVALTAHAMSSDAEACRAAGMAGFLTKPLLLDSLRAELARWLPELQ